MKNTPMDDENNTNINEHENDIITPTNKDKSDKNNNKKDDIIDYELMHTNIITDIHNKQHHDKFYHELRNKRLKLHKKLVEEDLETIEVFNNSCAICLDTIDSPIEDVHVDILNCGHCFHSNCIVDTSTCPLCRKTTKILLTNFRDNVDNLEELYEMLIYQNAKDYVNDTDDTDRYFQIILKNLVDVIKKNRAYKESKMNSDEEKQYIEKILKVVYILSHRRQNTQNLYNIVKKILEIFFDNIRGFIQDVVQSSINNSDNTARLRIGLYVNSFAVNNTFVTNLFSKLLDNDDKLQTTEFNNQTLLLNIIHNLYIPPLNILKLFIDRDTKVLAMKENHGYTPINLFLYLVGNLHIVNPIKNIIKLLTNSTNSECLLTPNINGYHIPLHSAIFNKETCRRDILRMLIDKDKKALLHRDWNLDTALHNLLHENVLKPSIVKMLIDKQQYCLVHQNDAGNTPLHLALIKNITNIPFLKLLMDDKLMCLKKRNAINLFPIDIIYFYNNTDPELLKLLEHGKQQKRVIQINNKFVHNFMTNLTTQKQKTTFLMKLFDNPNINIKTGKKNVKEFLITCVFMGISNRYIYRRIIELNPSVLTLSIAEKNTFLHFLIYRTTGSSDIINRLIDLFIDSRKLVIKRRNLQDLMPLHAFLRYSEKFTNISVNIIQKLIDNNKYVINSLIHGTCKALHYFIFFNRLVHIQQNNKYALIYSILSLLIDDDKSVLDMPGYVPSCPIGEIATIPDENKHYHTPLIFALDKKIDNFKCIKLLTTPKNILISDDDGDFPIMQAIYNNYTDIDILKLFIDCDDKCLLTPNKSNHIALTYALAIGRNNPAILQLLMDKNKECLTRTYGQQNKTPVELAKIYGWKNKKMLRILRPETYNNSNSKSE